MGGFSLSPKALMSSSTRWSVQPDVWVEKDSGLQPGDPGWDQALNIATAVQESSHTPEPALGYILSRTQPRLGVATRFQVNRDTVGPAVDSVQSWWEGRRDGVAVLTDRWRPGSTSGSIASLSRCG
jgi:ribonuclease Z